MTRRLAVCLRSSLLASWLVAMLSLSSPTEALAQGCADGRVATERSGGYCCWPGQTWSAEYRRCEGPPVCPAPRVAEGDNCVSSTAAVPEVPPEVRSPSVGPSRWVSTERPSYADFATVPYSAGPRSVGPSSVRPSAPAPVALWPSSVTRPEGAMPPRQEQQVDEALIGWGLALVVAGYAASVGGAVAAFEEIGVYNGLPSGNDSTCHDTVGALFLVPVLGSLLAVIAEEACSVPVYRDARGLAVRTRQGAGIYGGGGFVALGIASAAVELLGTGLAIGAALAPRTVTLFDAPDTMVSFAPSPLPGGLGLTLTVRSL